MQTLAVIEQNPIIEQINQIEQHPLAIQPADIHVAFARFLLIDVANGDATADTVKAYEAEVRLWVEYCDAIGIRPEAAQHHHVEMYREHLKEQNAAVSTRALKLSIIRRFYDAALRHKLLVENPAEGVKAGKDNTAPEEKIKALSVLALSTLFKGVPTDDLQGCRDLSILGLMAMHGLRRVEVHRLNHEDVARDGERMSLRVNGKGNKVRTVHIRPDIASLVEKYITMKEAAGMATSGALFVTLGNRSRGERIARRTLNHIVDTHLDATDLKREGVSCHALRHTFGTLAVAGGAKIEHLRDAMGHSKLETTGIYVRAVDRQRHNPANFIDVSIG